MWLTVKCPNSWGTKCCFLKCGGKRRLVKIFLPCLWFPLWCNSFCEQSNQLLHHKPSALLPQRSFSSPQLRKQKTRQALIFYSLCASYKLNHFSNGGHSDSFWTKDSGWSEKKLRVNVFLILCPRQLLQLCRYSCFCVENGVWKQYLENSSVCRPFCAVVTFNIVPWVNTNSWNVTSLYSQSSPIQSLPSFYPEKDYRILILKKRSRKFKRISKTLMMRWKEF